MRFNGESWRDDPELLPAMMRDFEALRVLHQRMLHLVEAAELALPAPLEARRAELLRHTARAWSDTPELAARYEGFLEALRALGSR